MDSDSSYTIGDRDSQKKLTADIAERFHATVDAVDVHVKAPDIKHKKDPAPSPAGAGQLRAGHIRP